MSTEDVEIVRRLLAAWARGDFRSEAELLDPALRFETFMPDGTATARGLDELEAFTREWLAQWRDYRIAAEQIREGLTGRVFVAVRQTGSGRDSGVVVDSPGYCVFALRDGKVVELSLHYDRPAALGAAGLSD